MYEGVTCREKTVNLFGHIYVFEKHELEVLDVGAREDVWGMPWGGDRDPEWG